MARRELSVRADIRASMQACERWQASRAAATSAPAGPTELAPGTWLYRGMCRAEARAFLCPTTGSCWSSDRAEAERYASSDWQGGEAGVVMSWEVTGEWAIDWAAAVIQALDAALLSAEEDPVDRASAIAAEAVRTGDLVCGGAAQWIRLGTVHVAL